MLWLSVSQWLDAFDQRWNARQIERASAGEAALLDLADALAAERRAVYEALGSSSLDATVVASLERRFSKTRALAAAMVREDMHGHAMAGHDMPGQEMPEQMVAWHDMPGHDMPEKMAAGHDMPGHDMQEHGVAASDRGSDVILGASLPVQPMAEEISAEAPAAAPAEDHEQPRAHRHDGWHSMHQVGNITRLLSELDAHHESLLAELTGLVEPLAREEGTTKGMGAAAAAGMDMDIGMNATEDAAMSSGKGAGKGAALGVDTGTGTGMGMGMGMGTGMRMGALTRTHSGIGPHRSPNAHESAGMDMFHKYSGLIESANDLRRKLHVTPTSSTQAFYTHSRLKDVTWEFREAVQQVSALLHGLVAMTGA